MATKKSTAKGVTTDLEEAFGQAQEHVLSAVAQGQDLVLKGYKTMVDTISASDLPSVPGLSETYELRSDLFDQAFGFGIAMLESSREFTKQVLEVAAGASR